MKYILSSLLLVSSSLLVSAHNNLFFPGDAFFSSTVGLDDSFKKKEVSLQYEPVSGTPMACGTAGCHTLKVKNISAQMQTNLEKVNKLVHGKYMKQSAEDRELNKFFHILVYNRNTDVTKMVLGNRYNEDWASLQTEKAKKGHAMYPGFTEKDLIINDWMLAKKIKGLSLTKGPKTLDAEDGVEEAIEVEAKDIVFVYVVAPDLNKIATRDFGTRFFVIGETVKEYACDGEKLEEVK